MNNANYNSLKSINYFNSLSTFNTLISLNNQNQKINILYFNAMSMRNKLNDIQLFINSFIYPIHIIIITETWLYKEENMFFELPGYTSYHSNRLKQKTQNENDSIGHCGRGGGVSVYVLNNLLSVFVFEEYIDNNNYLIVKLIQLNKYIIAVYRPPIRSNESIFIHKIEKILSQYINIVTL